MQTDNRPAIPAELKRKILVEAGHRCAIPTCRATQVEVVHIIPWPSVREHKYENLIALCPNCHTRYDNGQIDRNSMYMYKDNLRFFIDKYSKFELDVLFELIKEENSQGMPFPTMLDLLVKALFDNGLIVKERKGQQSGLTMEYSISGIDVMPMLLKITQKGKEFIGDFSTKKIGYEKD